jgi:putative transcription antitermination factor YqgF
MNQPHKTLAIDFGTKRIGLAVNYLSLAQPLEIIPNNEHTFEKLKQICKEQGVKQIILGLSERKMAETIKEWATLLKKELDLPVEFWDENFSSVTVHKKIAKSHMKKSERQKPIDHYAAAEILQEWLDSN